MEEKEKISCDMLKRVIEKRGYEIVNVVEDKDKCIIDFVHPKMRPGYPILYETSAVQLKDNVISAVVRTKVDNFKELYLDYCCEKENGECIQTCRPHVQMQTKTLSVEATFFTDPLKKFERLLDEMF